MNRIIVGMITMPFSLSNHERLLWFDKWLGATCHGLKGNNLYVEVAFTHEIDLLESAKYLINYVDSWNLLKDFDFILNDGIHVRFNYTEDSEKIINELRS